MKTIKTDSIKIGESIISGENDRLLMLKSSAEINTIKSNHIDSIYGPFLERNNNIFKLKTNFKVSFSDVFQIEKVELSNISNSIEFGKTELTLQNAYTYLNAWFSFETEVEKYFYYAFIKYDDSGAYDVIPLMNSFIAVDLGETPVADEAVVQVLLNIRNIEQSVKSIQFIKIDLQAEDIFDTVHIFETNITNDVTKVINIMSQETTASNFKFKDDNSVVIYDLYKSDILPKNSRKYNIENTETVIPKNTEYKDLLMPVYELKYTNPIAHTHPVAAPLNGAQIKTALSSTETIDVKKGITYPITTRVSTYFDFDFVYGTETDVKSNIRNYNISVKKEDLKDIHGVPVTNQLDNTVLSTTPKSFITQLKETNVYDNIERTIDIPKYGVETNLSTKSRDSNKKEFLYEFPVYFPTDEFFYTNSETQNIQYSFIGKANEPITSLSSQKNVFEAFEFTGESGQEKLSLVGSGSCINTVTLYRLLKPKVVIFNFKSFDDSISSVLLSSKLTIEPRPTFIDIENQIPNILDNITVKFEKTTYTKTNTTAAGSPFNNFVSSKTQTDAIFENMIKDYYILYKSINTTLKPVKYLFSDVNPMFSGLDHKGITGGLCITSDGINVDKPEDRFFKYIE